jgi:hypothetical protein
LRRPKVALAFALCSVTEPTPTPAKAIPIAMPRSSITARGPKRSIMCPINGLTTPDTTKPNEKAPAVTPRSHPNSEMISG